jgi:Family of unknown function (DUF5677)
VIPSLDRSDPVMPRIPEWPDGPQPHTHSTWALFEMRPPLRNLVVLADADLLAAPDDYTLNPRVLLTGLLTHPYMKLLRYRDDWSMSGQNDGHDLKHHAPTLLHARACLVASEVQSLLRSRHAAGAQARWRTLYELSVIAFALGNNSPEISERFLLHRRVERYKDATFYQQYCEALGDERYSDEEMAEFQRQRGDLIVRFRPPFKNDWGWATPLFPANSHASLAKLAELLGLDHLKPWFRLSSHGIHSGATGAMHVWDFYGRGDAMLADASNGGLADPGNGALICLFQATSALLIYGGTGGPKPQDLVALKATVRLLDRAQDAFLEIHQALEAEEAEIRAKQSSRHRVAGSVIRRALWYVEAERHFDAGGVQHCSC